MSEDNKTNKAEKSQLKLIAVQRVKELSRDSVWTIPQQLLQEIVATFKVQQKKLPAVKELIEVLTQEISMRYKDVEVQQLLIDSIPSQTSIGKWMKKDGWEEAVWEKCKIDGLFTSENRAEMIAALFTRGKTRSDSAAKLWLTMSGDYSDKLDVNSNDTLEQFREINRLLHSKSNTDDS